MDLEKYALPTRPGEYARSCTPSLSEWQALWHLWDTVTLKMIPKEQLLEKPIKLRNACIFYLGHIPTFLDMKLADTTDGKYTEPSYFPRIFERGIDPDVDNPEHCHAHSEVPDSWPALDVILSHQQRVRERVKKIVALGGENDPSIDRCLWLGYEHEAMHLETLLYMLVQSDKTLSPPGLILPDFQTLAAKDTHCATPNQWFDVPAQTVRINMDDEESDQSYRRYFGWDIEKPSYKTHVHAIQAKGRPITNGEYAHYLVHEQREKLPASWTVPDTVTNRNVVKNGQVNGISKDTAGLEHFLDGKAVKTVYGNIPLRYALEWPVSASYDELSGCAAYMGGRIPTMEEVQSIYQYVEHREEEMAAQALGKTIPAVNSHLVNDGVEESPPQKLSFEGDSPSPMIQGELDPKGLFIDLDGKNVGFQQWTPCSVAGKGNKLQGRGGMGGLWEWTSSPLRKHNGYEPMKLYEAYSQDFFDEKHNLVLGGSWATVPRIAGRRTFVNWYQRNYPYAWAGARLVRDV